MFTGDGATSEGDFHESLNVAAVWDLPVLFIIENNGYGLSTPKRRAVVPHGQFRGQGRGYGIEGVQLAGNNIPRSTAKRPAWPIACGNGPGPSWSSA
ncbi:MAG: thiamine pyrophosphate-dependent enzyme [Flavobacteriales bacterium]